MKLKHNILRLFIHFENGCFTVQKWPLFEGHGHKILCCGQKSAIRFQQRD